MPASNAAVTAEDHSQTSSSPEPGAIARRAHELLAESPSIADVYFDGLESDDYYPSIRVKLLTKDFRDEVEQVSYYSDKLPLDVLEGQDLIKPGILSGPSTIVAEKQDGYKDYRIALREVPDARKKGGKRRLVEIYDSLQRITSLDVTDQHGPFITEGKGSWDVPHLL
jgi:hypothetical protein